MFDFKDFKTIGQLIRNYDTEEKCSRYVAVKRWEGKPVCPHCDNAEKIYEFSDGIYFKCSACKKKFTVRVGTIFQDSRLPLSLWFQAIWFVCCQSKGISSVQLGKNIGVTQKTAWFMIHRLRDAMQDPEYTKPLEGVVEMDEAYIGGKEKNKHKDKKSKFGTWADAKEIAFGMVERNGKLRIFHVADRTAESILPVLFKNLSGSANAMTDEYYAYGKLSDMGYSHSFINHSAKQYVNGDTHTNSIENAWSGLKRVLHGTYHWASAKHLQKYFNEFSHRFNNRKALSNEKFDVFLNGLGKGKLSYKSLIKN